MAKSKKAASGSKKVSRKGRSSKKTATAVKARPRKPARATTRKTSSARARSPRLKKTPLSSKQLREFRDMLLAKRRTLLGDMTGMEQVTGGRRASGNLSNMPTHMADVGSDNFEHEFTLGLLESEQSLLREIDQALERIENKTYGICLGTGEPIPLARLRARPWASYTVEYARMLEKGLVRSPGSEGQDEEELQANSADAEPDQE